MSAILEKLNAQFTALIGPEAFAKHASAVAAAQAAIAAHAAVVAQAAAAAKAAAAAAPKPTPPASAPAAPSLVVPPSGGSVATPPKGGTTNPAPQASATSAAPKPATPAATAPKPAAPPAPPPPPPAPLQTTSHALKGYDLDAIVAPSQVVAAASLLDAQGFGLDAITGVDWPAQNEMEIVYDYFHPFNLVRVVVRTRVPRLNPELPTISDVFPGANWHERETHDFFGIRFSGHPNLKPFLLPEDADFHPLRKDYAP